jgi:hypothetical protein
VQQVRVLAQLGGHPRELDAAAVHHVGVVGDPERDGRELLDQEHPDPGLGHRAQRWHEPLDHHGREAERELVDEDEARLGDQRLGEHEHLLLAARHRSGPDVEPLDELGEHLQGVLATHLRLASWQGIAGDVEVVGDRQLAQQAPSLRNDRDARLADALGALAAQVLAVEQDAAGLGAQDAADREHEARLAGAVGSQQRGDLAAPDLQRHVAHDRPGAARDRHLLQQE